MYVRIAYIISSGNLQQAGYCASTGDTEQYWRSTVNCTGAVLAEPWHDHAIQY